MQGEEGTERPSPAPSWVPGLCGARSQSPAVGICVYLQYNNDPRTWTRMSQLPVQGRIPHQASPLKTHHLEMQQLKNPIKLALLTSERLKPFHARWDGKQQSPQSTEISPQTPGSAGSGWMAMPTALRSPCSAPCSPQRVNPHPWSCSGHCWLPGAQP